MKQGLIRDIWPSNWFANRIPTTSSRHQTAALTLTLGVLLIMPAVVASVFTLSSWTNAGLTMLAVNGAGMAATGWMMSAQRSMPASWSWRLHWQLIGLSLAVLVSIEAPILAMIGWTTTGSAWWGLALLPTGLMGGLLYFIRQD
ncbi:MAG TPA: hypothetical protein VLI05_00465 [Candidatus Saccharimonadia bacterium]|nr:hypothetical protein [Candidatus Saccharimonadia bacterium]